MLRTAWVCQACRAIRDNIREFAPQGHTDPRGYTCTGYTFKMEVLEE